MVSFARARTKSWLSRLWPMPVQSFKRETINMDETTLLIEQHSRQNKRFIELSKNGGMWFS